MRLIPIINLFGILKLFAMNLKKNYVIYLINSTLAVLFLVTGCKKDNPDGLPVISTSVVSEITEINAKSGGTISSDGGESVIARGVCWSTEPNPTILQNKTEDGSGGGTFISLLTGLEGNTTYFVRAYASNRNGTSYGMAMSFTTVKSGLPTLKTADAVEITEYSAESGGEITDDGGSDITSRGLCWDTVPSPTVLGNHTIDGNGTGSFTTHLSGLHPYTKYYLRAYASNSSGTGYGNEVSFTTLIGEDIFKLAGYGSKTWKLLRDVSSGDYPVECGKEDHTQLWWAMGNGNNALHDRQCMLNDEWIFSTDGSLEFKDYGDYWAESGVFNTSLICANSSSMVGINGEDLSAWGSGIHSYAIRKDPVRKLTSIGKGAYLGFYKLGNGEETRIPLDSVRYNIVKLTDNSVDTLIVEGVFRWDPLQSGGYWRFVLVHYDNPGDEPPIP